MAKRSLTENFLRKSQKKINELKTKLQAITQKEVALEEEEKKLVKEIAKPKQEIRVVLSIDSIVKATFAILLVIGFAYLLFFIKNIPTVAIFPSFLLQFAVGYLIQNL